MLSVVFSELKRRQLIAGEVYYILWTKIHQNSLRYPGAKMSQQMLPKSLRQRHENRNV